MTARAARAVRAAVYLDVAAARSIGVGASVAIVAIAPPAATCTTTCARDDLVGCASVDVGRTTAALVAAAAHKQVQSISGRNNYRGGHYCSVATGVDNTPPPIAFIPPPPPPIATTFNDVTPVGTVKVYAPGTVKIVCACTVSVAFELCP